MAIGLDEALGVHGDTLIARSRRAEVLATNLANQDTPGYLARDLDFKAVLAGLGDRGELHTTHPRHVPESGADPETLLYRVPLQPALDGNSVEPHVEKGEFTNNAVRYFAELTFLNSKVQGVLRALRGE